MYHVVSSITITVLNDLRNVPDNGRKNEYCGLSVHYTM
jgi:hypothetical protein